MSKFKPTVELMPLDKIKPYEKNAKIHTELQIQSLMEVIKTQGWDVPIVVDKDGVVIKGHGRRLAAMAMGLKEVPVIVRRDLTEAQVKAARLSDNRVAMGDFDVDAIKDELESLKTDGYDLNSMGFGEKEVQMMLGDLDAINFAVLEDESAAPSGPLEVVVNDTPTTSTEENHSPSVKAVLLTDVLGFKHVPGEYKEDLVNFLAHAESGELKGGEALGALIRRILQGMTADETAVQ